MRGVTVTLKGGSRHCRPMSLAIAPWDARQQKQSFYRAMILLNDPDRKATSAALARPKLGSTVHRTLGGWTGGPVRSRLVSETAPRVPWVHRSTRSSDGLQRSSRQTWQAIRA